jgi:hypothetical protein
MLLLSSCPPVQKVRVRYQGREIVGDPYDFYMGVRSDANTAIAATERAVIEIRFSWVYGDRWLVRSDRIVPERL